MHAGGYNYGHWLVDCLPGAIAFLSELREGRLKLAAPPLSGWQARTLILLGVPPGGVSEVLRPAVRCADLVFSSLHGMRDRVRHDAFIRLTTQRIAEGETLYPKREPVLSPGRGARVPDIMGSSLVRGVFDTLRASVDPPRTGPQIIYVSREGVITSRRMTNEAELVSALEGRGATIVHPEDLTIDEQIRTFSNARVIIGPIGAGLSNMGFAPPGCCIVEILPSNCTDVWNLNLASIVRHRYAYVLASVPEGQITPVDVGGVVRDWVRFDFQAPIRRVVDTVERILEGTRMAL
jgi:capsular polysaccharide biosynthesis protein